MDTHFIDQGIGQYLSLLSQRYKPYQTCRELSDYMHRIIDQDETEPFRKSIKSIFSFYEDEADYTTKNAIENVLLYCIGSHITLCDNRKKMFGLLPDAFRRIIINQMIRSGI